MIELKLNGISLSSWAEIDSYRVIKNPLKSSITEFHSRIDGEWRIVMVIDEKNKKLLVDFLNDCDHEFIPVNTDGSIEVKPHMAQIAVCKKCGYRP